MADCLTQSFPLSFRTLIGFIVALAAFCNSSDVHAQRRAPLQRSSRIVAAGTYGYYPYTIARPGDRQWIHSLPMEERPNRPLHFYGNAVRRETVQRPSYDLPPTLPLGPSSIQPNYGSIAVPAIPNVLHWRTH